MILTVMYTPGRDIRVRGRRSDGLYWQGGNTFAVPSADILLAEASGVPESRYFGEADVAALTSAIVLEYVDFVSGETVAEETYDPTIHIDIAASQTAITAALDAGIQGLNTDLAAMQADITLMRNDVTLIRAAVVPGPDPERVCGLLGARMLMHVRSPNNYKLTDTVEFTEGDAGYVYFQLVDYTQDQEALPPYRRYVPASASTLMVRFKSNDNRKTVARAAEAAFPNDDRSIWRVAINADDVIIGSRDMMLTLSESGGKVTHGYVKQALMVQPQDKSR